MEGLVAIAGTGSPENQDAGALVRAMGARLAHRGVVSSVIEVGGGVVAAVGESTTARVGDVAVCLHGNVSVPDDVRSALRHNVPDATQLSDPAVVAAATVSHWGPKGVSKLRGDFALVALSANGELVTASRDRSGLKPLLWRQHAGRALFASEASALVDVRGVPRPTVNEGMVAEYLSGAPQNRSETMWSGADRVEPRTMVVHSGNRYLVESAEVESLRDGQEQEVLDWDAELLDTFVGAVERCLVNDVTAIELSGGFDSTTVLGVAASLRTSDELLAAVRDYTGTPTEETVYWRAALDKYDVDALITPWDVEIEPWMLDDAKVTADRPCLPHLGPWRHELAALSARGIRVSLTGQGGDERLGHSYELPWQLLSQGEVNEAVTAAQHHLGVDERTARKLMLTRGPRRIAGWHLPKLRSPNRTLRSRVWLRPDFVERVELGERLTRPRYSSESMTVDELSGWAFGEIPNQYLEAAERCAARQGIDLRHPFLDPDLVDLCLRMPESVRTAPNDPRAAHRRVFGTYLPDQVLNRNDKADFTSQYVDRLSSEGIFTDAFEAAIVQAGWVDGEWLAEALARLEGGSNAAAALVSILATVEAWAQRWL